MVTSRAKAHTNIALIKYWGKRDKELFLPYNSSISLTLDQFYTLTSVGFSTELLKDHVEIDGSLANEKDQILVSKFLDKVRKLAGIGTFAKVKSENHVPMAVGFASSASAYAALGAAAVKACGLELTDKELSILVRQGSGSASRSVYGGFVKWHMGHEDDGSDSYSQQMRNREWWDLRVISLQVSKEKKSISSRQGMETTVRTSPFYEAWVESVPKDIEHIEKAIENRDFPLLGQVAEYNALKMHGSMMAANPPFMYFTSGTLEVMEEVRVIRSEGIPVYFTIDAGPNVKVLCQPEDQEALVARFRRLPKVLDIIVCKPGPGIEYVNI